MQGSRSQFVLWVVLRANMSRSLSLTSSCMTHFYSFPVLQLCSTSPFSRPLRCWASANPLPRLLSCPSVSTTRPGEAPPSPPWIKFQVTLDKRRRLLSRCCMTQQFTFNSHLQCLTVQPEAHNHCY